jgi:phosphate transport system permease protein
MLVRRLIGVGGISVIIFIALIFFYLAYVVLPLFKGAEVKLLAQYPQPGVNSATVYLAMEEQKEIGARFTDDGGVIFFNTVDGKPVGQYQEKLPDNVSITSFAPGNRVQGLFVYGLSNGQAIVLKQDYKVSFPNDKRVITPGIAYPLSQEPVIVDEAGKPLVDIAVQNNDQEATIAAATADGRLILTHFAKETSFLDDSVTLERSSVEIPPVTHPVDYILIDKNQRHLFFIGKNSELTHYDITDKSAPELIENVHLLDGGKQVTAVKFLAGDISILVGSNKGSVTQWSLVRQEDSVPRLLKFRSFNKLATPITDLAPEYNRKGFLAAGEDGRFGIFHTTAERTLLIKKIADHRFLTHIAVAPRADAMLGLDNHGDMFFWHVDNEHPEVSWSSLWGKVLYENYDQPKYIWQSSSASDDFEPKFSLVPITFGTIKAAFYAMLLAIPLALMGAIYTAHFMAPHMRSIVKPTIEIMEALPTVILGFLAGLWLAPFVEQHLPGVFSVFLLMPLGLLFAAYTWTLLPVSIRHSVPAGWEAALLLPVVALIVWISIALSPLVEDIFFGGDMRLWLTNDLGVGFDQRNAIVVGLAMGFAVIPTIFSIAEDAVFGVPKHLVRGSLALGATPWQTVIRVVLLTASRR